MSIRNCRFAIRLTVQPEISRLERHLHESIGTETMALDEGATVVSKLQCLTVILADEIGYPGFSVPHTSAEFRCGSPLELLGRRLDVFVWFVLFRFR